jgi:hypothetical protein
MDNDDRVITLYICPIKKNIENNLPSQAKKEVVKQQMHRRVQQKVFVMQSNTK